MRYIKNRDVLLDLIPRRSVCAEVGVLAGDYAKKILDAVQPSRCYLIDLFTGTCTSGDQHAENMRTYDLDHEYQRLSELYAENDVVILKKGNSYNTLKELPDNHLDFIYIDTDHTFDGTFIELELAYHKVRSGGFICGHDYSETLFPECVRAVDQFCKIYGQKLAFLTEEDKSPSFAILLDKKNLEFTEALCSLILERGDSMISPASFRNLKRQIDHVVTNEIPGAIVETGVWKGGGIIFMHKYLQYIGNSVRYQNRNRWVLPWRKVIACDSFQGLPEPSADDIMHNGEHAPSIDFGRARSGRKVFAGNLGAFNIRESELTVLEGWFKDTLPGIQESISLLRMDGYYYSSTMTTLDILYEKVSPGGVILIDGYSLREGCRKAVLDFLDKRGLTVDICMTEDDNADAWFIKK